MQTIEFNGKLPPPLSAKENMIMLEEYKKTGDLGLKEKILLGNLRLVTFTVSKMHCEFGVLEEDMYSMGIIELSKAIDSFDPTKSINFSTYAVTVINKNIFNTLKRQQDKGPAIISLEEPLTNFEDADFTLEDALSDDSEDPQLWDEDIYNKKIIEEVCWYIKNKLGDKKRFIMEHIWGINGCERLDGVKISKLMNRPKAYVYNEYRNTVAQIKEFLIYRGLIEGKPRKLRTMTKKEDLTI